MCTPSLNCQHMAPGHEVRVRARPDSARLRRQARVLLGAAPRPFVRPAYWLTQHQPRPTTAPVDVIIFSGLFILFKPRDGDIWRVKLHRLIRPLCALRLLGQQDYTGGARAPDRSNAITSQAPEPRPAAALACPLARLPVLLQPQDITTPIS
ncbi:unnamed protein product [Spodoptera exigua]|nr:unnamed protein product [Spodoptera exigua]